MKIIVLLFMIFNLSFASKITVFKVEGMHCPLCTTAIKKAINEIDGIKKVSARLNTKEVTVVYDEEKVKIEDILKAVKTTSYEAVELTTSDYKEWKVKKNLFLLFHPFLRKYHKSIHLKLNKF